MNTTDNQYGAALKRSWKSISTWTLVFFIATFTYLSFQKQRYEMTLIVPSAIDAYSFDAPSLTELMRQYIKGSFSSGLLSDLKSTYGDTWSSYSTIRKNDLIITQRGNIYIIRARASSSTMAQQLGETMAQFIQSTKGPEIMNLKEKATEYKELQKRLRSEIASSDSIMDSAIKSRNLTNMIGFYAARQSNYENLLSVGQLSLQTDKYIQIHDFLDREKKTRPVSLDSLRFLNSLLFGFLGMIISIILAFSKAHHIKK